jgi:hypothetical protein
MLRNLWTKLLTDRFAPPDVIDNQSRGDLVGYVPPATRTLTLFAAHRKSEIINPLAFRSAECPLPWLSYFLWPRPFG